MDEETRAMSSVMPDTRTDFGARVARRLREEPVIWLTTVGADGTPQPNPVWFLWDGQRFLIYSRADATRLAHIRVRPRVSLHFNSDDHGDDIVIFSGDAELVEGVPPADQHAEYMAKYQRRMVRVSGTTQDFAAQYPVTIHVTPTKARGF